MANQQQISPRPWILEAVPLLVVILIAAHVLALVMISVHFFSVIFCFSETLVKNNFLTY